MSENTSPLKATLKAGSDFSAPWLTVDATSVDELEQRLQEVANGGVPQYLIEAANVLKAANNAAPILPGGQEATQAPAAAPSPAPSPQNNGWGNQQAPAQQAAPPQQQRQFGGPPHPEGKQCEDCGKVLEFKKTSTGKGTWRCSEWRWNNGSPNSHTQLWAD